MNIEFKHLSETATRFKTNDNILKQSFKVYANKYSDKVEVIKESSKYTYFKLNHNKNEGIFSLEELNKFIAGL